MDLAQKLDKASSGPSVCLLWMSHEHHDFMMISGHSQEGEGPGLKAPFTNEKAEKIFEEYYNWRTTMLQSNNGYTAQYCVIDRCIWQMLPLNLVELHGRTWETYKNTDSVTSINDVSQFNNIHMAAWRFIQYILNHWDWIGIDVCFIICPPHAPDNNLMFVRSDPVCYPQSGIRVGGIVGLGKPGQNTDKGKLTKAAKDRWLACDLHVTCKWFLYTIYCILLSGSSAYHMIITC